MYIKLQQNTFNSVTEKSADTAHRQDCPDRKIGIASSAMPTVLSTARDQSVIDTGSWP